MSTNPNDLAFGEAYGVCYPLTKREYFAAMFTAAFIAQSEKSADYIGEAFKRGDKMSNKFILDGKVAVPCDDLMAWGRWLETADRKVAFDKLEDCEVSTVFLGLDHSFGSGAPFLFETMIFNGEHDGDQWRHTTWEEAEAFHRKLVEALRAGTEIAELNKERP